MEKKYKEMSFDEVRNLVYERCKTAVLRWDWESIGDQGKISNEMIMSLFNWYNWLEIVRQEYCTGSLECIQITKRMQFLKYLKFSEADYKVVLRCFHWYHIYSKPKREEQKKARRERAVANINKRYIDVDEQKDIFNKLNINIY